MMALIKVGTACFNGLASVFRHFVGIEARITLCDQNVSRRVQHRVDGGLCSAFVAMARDQSTPFDALVLPGGHAKGMRPYLESAVLQGLVGRFFEPHRVSGSHRPVAAVCHGVLLAARSRHADTGRSMLWGRKTTALTWKLEKSAWDLTRWWARFWDPTYYRTYTEAAGEPAGYWGVEAEVKRALASDADCKMAHTCLRAGRVMCTPWPTAWWICWRAVRDQIDVTSG